MIGETIPLSTANEPDIVVLGAGMGGLSCMMRARALGARVLLVEPEALGGT
jgi:glutathione reductase (NADPH)